MNKLLATAFAGVLTAGIAMTTNASADTPAKSQQTKKF